MEKALSTLTQFKTSKEGIEQFVNQVVNEVQDGTYNPLQLKIFLKAIQKSCEEIEKKISDLCTAEADKYGQRSFEVMGAKVELAELGTKYDFSKCNHPALPLLESNIKKMGDKKKEIETMLKTVKESMVICNEDTGGESVEICPPTKSSISGIKITLK